MRSSIKLNKIELLNPVLLFIYISLSSSISLVKILFMRPCSNISDKRAWCIYILINIMKSRADVMKFYYVPSMDCQKMCVEDSIKTAYFVISETANHVIIYLSAVRAVCLCPNADSYWRLAALLHLCSAWSRFWSSLRSTLALTMSR